MSTSTIVSAEKSEEFVLFDRNNLIVDIDNAAHTKATNVCGMFIPVKLQVPTGLTSFKLQTPECGGYVTDCDQNNPGKQYKLSLKINSTEIDSSFHEEDITYQQETIEILEKLKNKIVDLLKEKQKEFNEKFNEKNKQKRILPTAWNNMLDSFEVVRTHQKSNGGTDFYMNPKLCNTERFKTTFTCDGERLSFESAIEKLFNKKVYCIALISIDSLFFQATSNKLFIQAKVSDMIVTRFHSSSFEKIKIPVRFNKKQSEISEDYVDIETETKPDELSSDE